MSCCARACDVTGGGDFVVNIGGVGSWVMSLNVTFLEEKSEIYLIIAYAVGSGQ